MVTVKEQPTNHCNFYVLTTYYYKTEQSKPRPEAKYHNLTKILHLTLKMSTVQVVKTITLT